MTLKDALLESWDRQCRCLDNLSTLITPELMDAVPAEEGWSIAYQLCHIHETRMYWLFKASGQKNPALRDLYYQVDEEWFPSKAMEEICEQLSASANAVRDWVRDSLTADRVDAGPYDHPVFFLQHMIWHEGYHFGSLVQALRRAGHEPTEEWEEANVWGLWRGPE